MSSTDDSSQTSGFVRDNVLKIVDKNRKFYGTGFCLKVNQYKFIITCHHCIYKLDQIFVEKNDKQYSCKWVKQLSDMNMDLAILVPDDKNILVQPLKHHLEAKPHLPVFMWSFSRKDLNHFPQGSPIENAELSSEYFLFTWPEEQPKGNNEWNDKPRVNVHVYKFLGIFDLGFSGAPVCYRENKKVIGIFTAKDKNYGFVIPIETILKKLGESDSFLAAQPTKNSMLYIENGNKFYFEGDFNNAIKEYDQLIYDQNYLNALNNKGNALSELGNLKEAILCYDIALSIDPNNFNPLSNKGRALCLLGEFKKAAIWLDKALDINPNDLMSLNQKGLTLAMSGRFKEAISYYDRILRISPNNLKAHFNKGEAHRLSQQYEQALLSFNDALRIDPNDVDSLIGKGYTYYHLDRCEEAIELFDQALHLFPNHPFAIEGKKLCKK